MTEMVKGHMIANVVSGTQDIVFGEVDLREVSTAFDRLFKAIIKHVLINGLQTIQKDQKSASNVGITHCCSSAIMDLFDQ